MMAEDKRTVYCGNCGSIAQAGDRFCGVCGARVPAYARTATPTGEIPVLVREPPPRAARTRGSGRGRARWIVPVALLIVVIASSGAIAYAALGPGSDLLGASGRQPSEVEGEAPLQEDRPEEAPPSPDGEPTPTTVSPDTPPDPAFDLLLPTLKERTAAPIMLPADLPDGLNNVAVDADASGDSYGILFLAEPTGNILEQYVHASDAGTFRVSPESEARGSGEGFEATSVEEVELPDGTEATLRYMEPAREPANYGPRWDGEFDKDGNTYTLSIPSADPSGEAARQALSSMVPVEGSEGEVAGTPEQDPDEEALQGFGYEYDEADRGGDWDTTYAMLGEESQRQFTEEEWVEKQQALQEANGIPAPLQSVSVDRPEGVSDSSANVILYYQDGTTDTIVAGIPMVVTSEEEAGEPKRTLTEEEIAYLEQVSTDGSSGDLAAQAEEAAGDYYRASGVEDWDYTYDALDSETQALFTREEWSQKNRWFADNGTTIYNIESVSMDETSQAPLAEVSVRLTGEDGSFSVRTTYFVREDGGTWEHRFGQEETDLFMPDATYEEFVEAQEG